MRVVMDATLLVALVAPDPRSEVVADAVLEWLDLGGGLDAPSLALYEVTSALTQRVRAGSLAGRAVREAWAEVMALPLTFHELEDGPRTVEIALALKRQSAYDAAYLALAERVQAEVWTLDERLARNAGALDFPVRLLEAAP